jgi:hypothetical protein
VWFSAPGEISTTTIAAKLSSITPVRDRFLFSSRNLSAITRHLKAEQSSIRVNSAIVHSQTCVETIAASERSSQVHFGNIVTGAYRPMLANKFQ